MSYNKYYRTINHTSVRATMDHIEPLTKGGKDELENMCICCDSCNQLKDSLDKNDFLEIFSEYINEIKNHRRITAHQHMLIYRKYMPLYKQTRNDIVKQKCDDYLNKMYNMYTIYDIPKGDRTEMYGCIVKNRECYDTILVSDRVYKQLTGNMLAEGEYQEHIPIDEFIELFYFKTHMGKK